jgi:hypothetical protein
MVNRWLLLCATALGPVLSHAQPAAADLLTSMAGAWDVQQRMWPNPQAAPVELPPAVAQRQLVQGLYLQEVMQSIDNGASQASPFTRNATLNFNPVTRQYEYTSLDSRAPQLMVERSRPVGPGQDAGELRLQGGTFLAPQWGTLRNVEFAYRLTLGPVSQGKQLVRLYLTPRTVLPKKEFLAFEYIYTRKP